MKNIHKDEINFLTARRLDDVGEVFEWSGRIFRGIWAERSGLVRDLFQSGFIAELIRENLFPDSWISNYSCPDYELIIEHRRISPILLPQEWSFSMLKDAALAVLNVGRIALKYGYNMKDCHGRNVLFDNNSPKYVDLGSFHLNREGVTGWQPYEEFLRFYYYPLFMWKDGLEYVSKLSIFSEDIPPHSEHFVYRHRMLRHLNARTLSVLLRAYFMQSRLALCDNQFLVEKTAGQHPLIRLVAKISKRFARVPSIESLERLIAQIKRKDTVTVWREYHDKIAGKPQRFDEIIGLVRQCCPDARHAIDLGGNQGLFSSKILAETAIETIICQDFDEEAIDRGYVAHKMTNEHICFANYNYIAPLVKIGYPVPADRFKSDIVFACDLLQHLILSQGFSLEYILKEIATYSRQYICVEFMPERLWTHQDSDNIHVPPWHTVDWFRSNFSRHFQLLTERQIAENHIVFIGAKM